VVEEALHNAGVYQCDIDAIVMVSCTGFVMPSLTAWLVNKLGFRSDVAQIPIAQMGCAAGGTAVNRSFDYCVAHPSANVLIVACEFCSLCYQPDDVDIGSLLSKALFGDAIASAVVRGDGGRGILLLGGRSHLLPDTEKWITYEVKETGFHFRLNKGVAVAMRAVAPVCETFVASHGFDVSNLDYYIFHTGGPRILDTMRDYSSIEDARLEFSRETLRQSGNIASASIFDVAARIFREPDIRPGATFLLAGFGPGITAEMAVGTWA
jgi:1,3,6,8-tetrahydroxynaphthalene synthase